MKTPQPNQSATTANMPSRQLRRAARFAPGGSIKIRFGGRMMLMVWRKRARAALLLGRLLKRSLRQLRLTAMASTMALSYAPAHAVFVQSAAPLPSGGVVASGGVAMSTATNVLTINQSTPQAIINWESFNINSGYKVKFVQPGATSSILNRVGAGPLSSIQGQIEANGKVWLINPAGIMIGSGATINVAGFVASTLQVSDNDFLANRLAFTGGAGAGTVTNNGSILTSNGGHVYLVGARVDNGGSIKLNVIDPIAPTSGKAILAAGDTVTITLADTTLPGIKVDVTGTTGSVNNIGQIISNAGSIGLAGALVRNTGKLDVSSVTSRDGRIFLQASNVATLDPTSIILTGAGGELKVTAPELRVETTTAQLDSRSYVQASVVQSVLNAGGNVSLVAVAGTSPSSGTISVIDSIVKSSGADATLSFTANNSIAASGAITSNGSRLNTSLSANAAGTTQGAVNLSGTALDLGAGTLSVNGVLNANSVSLSNLTVSAPDLVKFSGTNTLNANVFLPNAAITSGATLSGAGKFTATNLNWSGGTIAGTSADPSYDITNLTMTGSSTLDGRTVNLMAGGTSSATGAALFFKNSGVLNNAGTLTVSDQTQLGYFNSTQAGNSVINNSGVINSANTAQGISLGRTANFLGGGYNYANAIAFNNSGTINVFDGDLHVTGGGTHTGAFNVLANGIGKKSTLHFGVYSGGFNGFRTENIEASSTFSETGTNGGIATVDFSTSGANTTNLNTNLSLKNVALAGGILQGAGKLTAANFNWTGGAIAGASTDPSYDITNLTMTGSSTLDGRTVNLLAGGVSNAIGATLSFKNSGVFNNAGTLTVSDRTQLGYFNSPQAGNSVINNSGVINSTNTPSGISLGRIDNYLGGARDDLNAVSFNNTGTINVLDGDLHVTGGGTHTGAFNVTAYGIGKKSALYFGIYNYDFNSVRTENIDAGSTISTSGINGGVAIVDLSYSRFNRTNLNTNVTLKDVVISDGTLQGSGKLTATNLKWSGGTIAGGDSDQAYDVTNLTLTGFSTLNNRTLNLVQGGMSTASGSILSMQNNAVLNNAGTLSLSNNASLSRAGSFNDSGTINNSGAINSTNPAGSACSDCGPSANIIGSRSFNGSVDFNNTGIVKVKAGTLRLNSPLVTNNGQLQIDAGATLAVGTDLVNAQGAKISGAGTIALNGSTLTNNGVVAPGTSTSTGTLTINGNYTQGSTGELITKISGGGPGQYDQLNVTGATTLDGQLTVTSLNGYVPASGDALTLISGPNTRYGIGKFARVVAPDYLSVGYNLYAGAPVRINYVAGGTNFFTNADGDLDWANPYNWSGNYTPVSVSDVLIDTGFTVQHASGTDKIRSLTINANNGLNLSGGSLAVSGLSTVSGTLTVGPNAAATLSGGLAGAGTLTINGGNVQLGSASTIGNLGMTGGVLSGASNFAVSNSFQQSGGALQFAGATVDVRQSTGDLRLQDLTAAATNLTALDGAISQTDKVLTLGALTTQSASGTRLNNTANQITSLSATNTGSGDIAVMSAGSLTLGSISNIGGSVDVAAGGAITQSGSVRSAMLTTASVGGTTLNGANQVANFSGSNTGGGDINLVNTTRPTALTLLAIDNAAGGINVDNTGAIVTTGTLNAAQGAIKLTAHSPITVNSALTARDGITLTALPSDLGIDTVAINGTLASTTGNIVVSSGTTTTIGSTATLQVTPGSVIALTAIKGEVDVNSGATFLGALPTISQSVGAVLPPQSVTLNTIDSLEKTAAPFGMSSYGPTLLASLSSGSDADNSDGSAGSGSKKSDASDSSSDGAKSKSSKNPKSLPVCN